MFHRCRLRVIDLNCNDQEGAVSEDTVWDAAMDKYAYLTECCYMHVNKRYAVWIKIDPDESIMVSIDLAEAWLAYIDFKVRCLSP